MNPGDFHPDAAGQHGGDALGAGLMAQLAREERARAALPAVLPYLVAGDEALALDEELVIRTRAMLAGLSADLLRDLGEPAQNELGPMLAAALMDEPGLLVHCHALALEARLAERLAAAGLDPALSPLLEARLASAEPEQAALAMAALTAQARFMCRQQRMEAAAAELPPELLHRALALLGQVAGASGTAIAAAMRAGYDEARSRLSLLARIVLTSGEDRAALLDPAQAGAALFLTAAARGAGVPREEAALAAAAGQELRLGLLLRAAGAPQDRALAAIALIHPYGHLPADWLGLASPQAAQLLAGADA